MRWGAFPILNRAGLLEAFNMTRDRIARARVAGDPPDVIITPRHRERGLFDSRSGVGDPSRLRCDDQAVRRNRIVDRRRSTASTRRAIRS
jgi:hypothetical protein